MAQRWSSTLGKYIDDTEGRPLEQSTLDKEKLQSADGVGSKKFVKPVEEEDPSKMSPLQRAQYENRKKKGTTGADAAAALAGRK